MSPAQCEAAGSDQTVAYSAMAIYPSGDHDVDRIVATGTDDTCGCKVDLNCQSVPAG